MDDRDMKHEQEVDSVPATSPDEPARQDSPRRNASLERTLARIAVIHARMGFTSGDRTQEYIREARDGGMYGNRW